MTLPIYERIGGGYAIGRREDPRIAAVLFDALGDAQRVVNVGAGTGSYEPSDREVVAVEPSQVMASQRSETAAPVVRGVAEALPFVERTFDAAMGVLTIHHWTDLKMGLDEMRRVASRIVLFLRDPAAAQHWWLYDYFPATARLVTARETPLPLIGEVLGCRLSAAPVAIPADCVDGFEAAYWRRPTALLDAQVCAGMSALALISAIERADGQRRLLDDIQSGRWTQKYGDLLDREELDLGYRVVTAEPTFDPDSYRFHSSDSSRP